MLGWEIIGLGLSSSYMYGDTTVIGRHEVGSVGEMSWLLAWLRVWQMWGKETKISIYYTFDEARYVNKTQERWRRNRGPVDCSSFPS